MGLPPNHPELQHFSIETYCFGLTPRETSKLSETLPIAAKTAWDIVSGEQAVGSSRSQWRECSKWAVHQGMDGIYMSTSKHMYDRACRFTEKKQGCSRCRFEHVGKMQVAI